MTKRKAEQVSLFGGMYVVNGVAQQLVEGQVAQLRSVGHRVIPLTEAEGKVVLGASLSGGEVVLMTEIKKR